LKPCWSGSNRADPGTEKSKPRPGLILLGFHQIRDLRDFGAEFPALVAPDTRL